ncbi:hypothetical protein AALP_AA4G128000 [Arabis alpina]|uniref:Uncharacterized protein n=1 Tax=Arabis alpina TaxID=50452 RepID=A0A087H2W2_ARAAL|nr:hypothetical protein AALP_AA4G128000 [Arabis alpina]
MRRSASASIVSDQLSASSPSPSPSPPPRIATTVDSDDVQLLLPRYDPNSYPGKKDKSRLRSAENVIHFIPLVLILCAVILWIFSQPGNKPFAWDETNITYYMSWFRPGDWTLRICLGHWDLCAYVSVFADLFTVTMVEDRV